MAKAYRIGTRKSPLALRQVEEILLSLKRFYPEMKGEVVGIDSQSDKDRTTPISEIEGSDFFTKEIDRALLDGRLDFAIHSAKDLPRPLLEGYSIHPDYKGRGLPDDLIDGLTVAAITKSIDPYDVLVSREGLRLDELPYGAKIGTSSKRRKEALKRFRSDFQIADIRGNIEERLALLDDDARCTINNLRTLDAVVIAAAGLIRLGLENRITQRIPFEILKPHPLQGALAVVTRADDSRLIELLSVINYTEAILL